MRSLFGEPLERTNRLPADAAAAVERVVAARIEEEVPRVVVEVRARNRRPIEAVRTGIEERSPDAVAGTREKDTVRRIATPTANNISVNTIH